MENIFRQFSYALLILFGLLLIGCSKPIEADLVISNVNIIYVETGEIKAARDVIIIGDSIAQIKTHSGNQEYLNAHIVDGTGQYLIPGLWDMHAHAWWGYNDFFPLLIANGVTGIREMFGDLDAVKNLRTEIASGAIMGPDIITAGPIVDGAPAGWDGSDAVATPEEARAVVQRQVQEGADFIKVYSLLEPEVFKAVADECNKLNIPFVGHLPRKVKVEEAIEAGQKCFEHFNGMLEFTVKDRAYLYSVLRKEKKDTLLSKFAERQGYLAREYDPSRLEDLIKLLAENNVWIDPTSVVNRTFAYFNDTTFRDDDRIFYMPDYAIRDWFPTTNRFFQQMLEKHYRYERQWYHQGLKIMKPMLDGGVQFLAGTDFPNAYAFPGFSLHDELQIFVEDAGFTPLQALQTATLNPAIFLGKEMEFGKIETGKLASLVLLKANPLEDINNTRRIAGVLLRGRYMNGDSLKATIDAIAAKNKLPKIKDTIRKTILKNGIESGIAEYHQLKKNSPGKYNFDEEQLNSLGYELLGLEMAEEAVKILELNVKLYPAYGNGFDSLGDGYLAIGDTTRTIEVWEKAISLGNTATQSRLDELLKNHRNKIQVSN